MSQKPQQKREFVVRQEQAGLTERSSLYSRDMVKSGVLGWVLAPEFRRHVVQLNVCLSMNYQNQSAARVFAVQMFAGR
jgi:hypothetical protein